MQSLQTRFSGHVDFDEDSVIRLPSGLRPFVNETRYLLLSDERRRPLLFLQSLDDPDLCFITVPVRSVEADYDLRMEPEDLTVMGRPGIAPPSLEDITCLAILTFSSDGRVTANLMAPVVIDMQTRTGVQAIRTDGKYSHAAPLAPATAEQEPSCSS